MAAIETTPVLQGGNGGQTLLVTQNYTYVSGIYQEQTEPVPQFSSAADNVHYSADEVTKAEQTYLQQQSPRFFRIL
jgi:hypothetical protein